MVTGGWSVYSPNYYQVIGKYDIDNIFDGLVSKDNVFYLESTLNSGEVTIAKSEEFRQELLKHLNTYYGEDGITYDFKQVDSVSDYIVYKIEKNVQ